MSEIQLMVEPREQTGKNANRRLRAQGWIPAVVYGAGKDTVSIQVVKASFLEMIRKSSEHGVFLLKMGNSGKSRHTMIRNVETDPVSRRVMHVDFQRVLMDEKVRVEVPIELVGESTGVVDEGGVLDFIMREVTIECLPGDIPEHLQFDISELSIGDHAEADDLELPKGVELISDSDRVLMSVSHPRVEEEPEEDEDEMLLETEMAEPEVIGRGSDDDDAEDEEDA